MSTKYTPFNSKLASGCTLDQLGAGSIERQEDDVADTARDGVTQPHQVWAVVGRLKLVLDGTPAPHEFVCEGLREPAG
jgi:hypothetical protein